MRALILTFGTRGDVEPYIALGQALNRAGHEAVLGTAEGFRELVEESGVAFVETNSRMLELVQEVLPTMRGARDLGKTLRLMNSAMIEGLDEQLRAVRAVRPDILVYHPKTLGAPHLAEFWGIPAVLSLPLPFYTPTSAFPIPFVGRDLGPRLNHASYRFGTASSTMYGGMIDRFRTHLGLRPQGRFADPTIDPDGSPTRILYPYSEHVVPVPEDFAASAHVTGYWFRESAEAWAPPAGLAAFLDAGEPPVYIGFGSMGFGLGAAERGEAITLAVKATESRAVVATGWGGISGIEDDKNIFHLESAPHPWLFPRMRAVVHHGGAGTTGIGLAAGRPTLVCPFLGDQPFWGNRVADLGVGPRPLAQRKFTTEDFADRLGELLCTPSYAQVAEDLGTRIRAEDGPAEAVRLLESWV